MLKLVFKMLKFVLKMLKLVLKTPKLLIPAFSLRGLGWMSHKKKPVINYHFLTHLIGFFPEVHTVLPLSTYVFYMKITSLICFG